MDLNRVFGVVGVVAFALTLGVAPASAQEYPQPASSVATPYEEAETESTEAQDAPEALPSGAAADDTPQEPNGKSLTPLNPSMDGNTSEAGPAKPVQEEIQTAQAAGWEFDLLKSLPVEISGYEETGTLFPETLGTADQVLAVLNGTRYIALHMEALRRAYHQLPVEQQNRLVDMLHKRHREIQDDAMRYFDYGYAKLLFEDNKAGLYLLRKANDRLRTQFTSLAYAMAQVEVDLNQEEAAPDVLTTRKMDVKYKLSDAVTLDAEAHLPGFWPTFTQVVEKISSLPAYQDLIRRDFTQAYVPYGERVMPASESTAPQGGSVEEDAEPCAISECCELEKPPALNWGNLYRSITVDLNDDGRQEALHFFKNSDHDFRVLAVNRKNQVLADFLSPVAPYVLEDLDEDGIPEIVIRGFPKDWNKPVQVYRLNECRFTLDETVDSYFK